MGIKIQNLRDFRSHRSQRDSRRVAACWLSVVFVHRRRRDVKHDSAQPHALRDFPPPQTERGAFVSLSSSDVFRVRIRIHAVAIHTTSFIKWEYVCKKKNSKKKASIHDRERRSIELEKKFMKPFHSLQFFLRAFLNHPISSTNLRVPSKFIEVISSWKFHISLKIRGRTSPEIYIRESGKKR